MSQYDVLDQCLSLLRYVREGDQVFHDDINKPVECLRALSIILRQLRPDDPLIDELDSILSKIPYVKTGDIIMPDHHNLIVDALKKVRDILKALVTPAPEFLIYPLKPYYISWVTAEAQTYGASSYYITW